MPKATVHQITPEQARLSDFELFWECYPRPRNKLDARKAWGQIEADRLPIEEMLAACRRLAAECPDLQFCPYPAGWLRRGGFLDE